MRLQWELERAQPGARELYESQLLVWHYKDALQRADDAAAVRAQRAARGFVEREVAAGGYFIPGQTHFMIVWEALEYGRLDDAADELAYWAAHVRTDKVEDDNAQRTDARQLLSSQQRFLKHPASRSHWATPTIKASARRLANDIEEVLTADHRSDLHLLT